jgi:hypothetical protein
MFRHSEVLLIFVYLTCFATFYNRSFLNNIIYLHELVRPKIKCSSASNLYVRRTVQNLNEIL